MDLSIGVNTHTHIFISIYIYIIAFISLKGIRRLFSSFESSPRSRAALRKFLLVATREFMTIRNPRSQIEEAKRGFGFWVLARLSSNRRRRERNVEEMKKGVGIYTL